jgi:glycosyltransferase involved in cell wall biosynthesis
MVGIVIPAYNEEKKVGEVLRQIQNQARPDFVVVVDDASRDSTADVALTCGAVVVRHEINRGQGASLETGHEYARLRGADFVIDFDADGQFDAGDIIPAIEFLKKSGTDILFGTRFGGVNSKLPFTKKYLILPLGQLFNKIFLGIKMSDAHNGFRIYTKKALHLIRIRQDRMAHASEIPALVHKLNLSFCEFPIRVYYHEYGQRVGGVVKIIKDLFFAKFIK